MSSLVGLLCHQLPERSPWFGQSVFPLCYRCTGFYTGVLAAYVYLAATGSFRRHPPTTSGAALAGLGFLPFWLDGWGNFLGFWATEGYVRAAFGFGAGLVLPGLVMLLRNRTGDSEPAKVKAALPACIAWMGPAVVGLGGISILRGPRSPEAFAALLTVVVSGQMMFLATFLAAALPRRVQFWSAARRSSLAGAFSWPGRPDGIRG